MAHPHDRDVHPPRGAFDRAAASKKGSTTARRRGWRGGTTTGDEVRKKKCNRRVRWDDVQHFTFDPPQANPAISSDEPSPSGRGEDPPAALSPAPAGGAGRSRGSTPSSSTPGTTSTSTLPRCRSKRKLKPVARFGAEPHDEGYRSKLPRLKTENSISCPRCGSPCSCDAVQCMRCGVGAYYEAMVGAAVLKERGDVCPHPSSLERKRERKDGTTGGRGEMGGGALEAEGGRGERILGRGGSAAREAEVRNVSGNDGKPCRKKKRKGERQMKASKAEAEEARHAEKRPVKKRRQMGRRNGTADVDDDRHGSQQQPAATAELRRSGKSEKGWCRALASLRI